MRPALPSLRRPAWLTGPLRPFLLASLQSAIGNEMAYVALLLLAYEQSSTGWAITALLLAEFVPSLLLGSAAGALADHRSRRRLAVGSDLLRFATYLGLAFSPSILVTVTLAAVASVGQSIFRPASRASIPSLTASRHVGDAMGALSLTTAIASTAGPLIAAVFLLAGGPPVVLAVNAITFLISAAVLARLPLDAPATVDDAPADDGNVEGNAHADAGHEASPLGGIRATLRLLATLGAVPSVFVVGVGLSLAFAMINVAEPLLIRDTLGGSESSFALLVGLFGIGGVAGSALARSRLSLLFASGAGSLAAAGLAALVPSLTLAAVLFPLMGFFSGLFITTEDRLLATLVPQRVQGRIYGFKDSLEAAAFLIAYLLAGAIATASGPRAVYAASALAALVIGVAALRWSARRARSSGG